MSKLGSTFVSDDPDSRGTPGDTGPTGPAGPTGPSGDAPLTTKGDLLTFDTADARLGVGTDGQRLEADSSEATGLKWTSKIISDTTLGSAAQVIENTSLGNITEFDFELHIPPATVAADLSAYINGDTTAANYRTQVMSSFNASILGIENDNATAASRKGLLTTSTKGSVRLVNGFYYLMATTHSPDSTTFDVHLRVVARNEISITDFTQFSIDTDSGSNLLPIGTRLIILNPYV